MPTISVIIPVYKVERYLDACVASVVGQTYPDLEIILVDDGSPDNCPALCDAWAAKDTRIRVIHRSNGGLSAARNSGLGVCTGDYIAFVDSDDRLEPETLERALRAQQKSGVDLVLFHYICTDENDQPLPDRTPADREEEALTPPQFWGKFFASGDACTYYVVAWNKLYRAELFHTLRYAEGKRYEDMFLLPNLIGQCRKILCLNFRGYRYAQRTGSIMSQGDPRNYLDRSEYLLEWTHSLPCLRRCLPRPCPAHRPAQYAVACRTAAVGPAGLPGFPQTQSVRSFYSWSKHNPKSSTMCITALPGAAPAWILMNCGGIRI